MVPVTSLRPVNYQQPVVSYYYPPQPTGTSFYPLPPSSPTGPQVNELRDTAPGVMPQPGSSDATLPPMNLPTAPNGASYPKPGAKLRPEKTVSRTAVVAVRGEVVLNDQLTPRGGAKLVFMSAEKPEQKEYATANAYGEFDLRLTAGTWFMYVGGEKGVATYHKKITVGDRDTVDYKVVSR
jgi:hypothetical protein